MSERASALRNKIAQLRAAFVRQLPARLSESRRIFEVLRAHPADREAATSLHRFLHSIKGTGNSFGFQDIGAEAAQGERLVGTLLDTPLDVPAEFWQKLDECLANIELCVDVLQDMGEATPHEDLPAAELPRKTVETKSPGGKLVYICDDETIQLEHLSGQLQCFGYETVGFTDPNELFKAVLAKNPDAVIMDIHFPGGISSGTEVVAALKRETHHPLPVIFLSGYEDFAARLSAVQAGGDAYFHKPVRPLDLVAMLDTLTVQHEPEPYRVLVVDDEPEVAAYHSLILQDAGMIVCQAHDPSGVLDMLQDFRFDMVLVDMYMPGCSGLDLAKVIRQLPDYVGLPIVYLSSETDKKKQFSAMRVGAEGFLTKPVQPDELVSTVAIRAERMRNLRSLMVRDSLTGLFNHSTTTQLLENAIATAKRQDTAVCFAMIDVDHFKSVNDNYGHPAGDQVLLALGRLLQQRLRNSDIVGRYGGEEFAVILPEVSLEKAREIIDQLRAGFAKVNFLAGATEFRCSFSAGVASIEDFRHMETLREAADIAMYAAKKQGRNRVLTNR